MNKCTLAFGLLLATTPAFAQSGATQTPPAPNSQQSSPTPATSAPDGAMTTNPGGIQNPNTSGALGSGATTTPTTGATAAPSAAFDSTVPTPASK